MGSIELRNVSKSFGAAEVIRNVDLSIAEGEFTVFVGPSGCGKSTMLRMIAGLEATTSGEIFINGSDVTRIGADKRGLAMVFQSYALYPHMTVAENMGFSLGNTSMKKADADAKVKDAAEILQLGPLLDRKPKELSGGQRQRVAIGRAIVRDPVAFLFDEPLSNLDASLRSQMRIELSKLHKQLGKTMIYVTHDQIEAMTLADRIVVLHEGRIQQVGKPLEIYRKPANAFVAEFIGSPKMNLLPVAEITDLPGLDANATTIGLRPEHLDVTQASQGALDGEVDFIEHLGSDSYLHLALADSRQMATVRVAGDTDIALGARIGISWARINMHQFDATDHRIGA